MKKLAEKAFTLVELLIVIGIIGILATMLMINLNPAEAQKKSRDAKRLKDISTIQSIVEQANLDGVALGCPGPTACTSSAAGTDTQQPCTANFLGANVCNYAKSVPVDPLNSRTSQCASGTATTNTTCLMNYYFERSGVDYEINVRQESVSNASKIGDDGGNSTWMVEVFSTSNALITNAVNPT